MDFGGSHSVSRFLQRVHLHNSIVCDCVHRCRGQEDSMSSEQHAGLSREFIAQQRQRLVALHKQLLGGEENNLARERAFQLQHGDEAAEEEDTAQDMAQREVDQALHDVDDRRIANIERALQKIEDGSYGLSDLSGEPIPQARLEATPEAILTMQEERQREARS
jgi:DnaK suppressor protein